MLSLPGGVALRNSQHINLFPGLRTLVSQSWIFSPQTAPMLILKLPQPQIIVKYVSLCFITQYLGPESNIIFEHKVEQNTPDGHPHKTAEPPFIKAFYLIKKKKKSFRALCRLLMHNLWQKTIFNYFSCQSERSPSIYILLPAHFHSRR